MGNAKENSFCVVLGNQVNCGAIMIIKSFGMAALAVVSSATFASAFVVGGNVNGGLAGDRGGVFVELDPTTGFMVGRDNFDTDHLYAFNENQNVTASTDISLDVGSDIGAGQSVSSHYVFFDAFDFGTTQIGYVKFGAPIIGVATSTDNLFATDIFGSPSITYVGRFIRALEGPDDVSIDSSDPNRLNLDWKTSSPGDYVRVFTQADVTPVPLPSGVALMLFAFGGLGLVRWCTNHDAAKYCR